VDDQGLKEGMPWQAGDTYQGQGYIMFKKGYEHDRTNRTRQLYSLRAYKPVL